MTRRRTDLACASCGALDDLQAWPTGALYCPACRWCGKHAYNNRINQVCVVCLRLLHTRWTFEGPMIRDKEAYVRRAWDEYGLIPADLLGWDTEEQSWLYERQDAASSPQEQGPVAAPPPHHRLG